MKVSIDKTEFIAINKKTKELVRPSVIDFESKSFYVISANEKNEKKVTGFGIFPENGDYELFVEVKNEKEH